MRPLGLTTRLLLALGLVVFTVAASGGAYVHALHSIGERLALVNRVYLPIAGLGSRMLSPTEASAPLLDEARAILADARSSDPEERAALNAVSQQLDAIAQAPPDDIRDKVQQLGALLQSRVRAVADRTERDQAAATRTAVSGVGIVTAVALGVWWLSRRILRPLDDLTRSVGDLTAGRPYQPVPVTGRDEIATLARAVAEMARAVAERDAERERRQRAERLAMVGQMLAQVTHEVRNPLNALSLNAEVLLDDVRGGPGEPLAVELMAEIRRIEAVTERYLDLARRPAAQASIESPLGLAHSVVHALESASRRAGVEVRVEGEAPNTELDGGVVRRALWNLVQNATQAGATRIVVRVRTEGRPPARSRTVFEVEDDGPGVPEGAEVAIFEPFFTTRAQGTGLGLAIVRQSVEDVGGEIRYSRDAERTRFTVSV